MGRSEEVGSPPEGASSTMPGMLPRRRGPGIPHRSGVPAPAGLLALYVREAGSGPRHSHSMVAGGLELMS